MVPRTSKRFRLKGGDKAPTTPYLLTASVLFSLLSAGALLSPRHATVAVEPQRIVREEELLE